MTTTAPVRVLVAEDEAHLGRLLEQFLVTRGHHVALVSNGAAALSALRADAYDVALLDIVMPELDGLEVLRHLREDASPPEVIIITGNGTIDTAISAMRLGAFDYLSKPYRMAEIDVLVRRAWEKRELARENALLHTRLQNVEPAPELVTNYPPLRALMGTLERVASSTSPVLITGESGTGKEILANAIHRLSARGRGPLIDISCGAIGGVSVETELFGYEGGAFPGATARRAGLLELASNGTLFMDEVAALEQRLQTALLRVLEQGSFLRVGGAQKVAMNARLITATNRNMEELVAAGTFRQDLFYRINTLHLAIPPLRERRCDIELLARHFLTRFGGATPPALSEEAVIALERYDWPGNVRELRNAIERAVLMATGEEISARDLPIPVHGVERRSGGNGVGLLVSLAAVEREHIRFVLERVNWHQGRAAEILGISSKTLYRKIREYAYDRPTELQNSA